jgi:hypothetical protein
MFEESRFLIHESVEADIHSALGGREEPALLKALGDTSPCFVGGPFSSSSSAHNFLCGRRSRADVVLARGRRFSSKEDVHVCIVANCFKSATMDLCRVYKEAFSHSSVTNCCLETCRHHKCSHPKSQSGFGSQAIQTSAASFECRLLSIDLLQSDVSFIVIFPQIQTVQMS